MAVLNPKLTIIQLSVSGLNIAITNRDCWSEEKAESKYMLSARDVLQIQRYK